MEAEVEVEGMEVVEVVVMEVEVDLVLDLVLVLTHKCQFMEDTTQEKDGLESSPQSDCTTKECLNMIQMEKLEHVEMVTPY